MLRLHCDTETLQRLVEADRNLTYESPPTFQYKHHLGEIRLFIHGIPVYAKPDEDLPDMKAAWIFPEA